MIYSQLPMQNTNADPVQDYLLSKWNNISNTTAKQTVISQAEAKLGELKQQIEEDQLKISETTKNIERRPPPPPPQVSPEDRLKEILHKKQQMMTRLNLMAMQESKLKENSRHAQVPNPKPKSQITPDDLQLIKSLNASYRNFQKELEKKTREYEEKQRQFRQEEQELEASHKEEKNKAKRQEIMAKLEAIRQREQQRQQKKLQDEKALVQLRTKRNLYQEWHNKFIDQQQQQQKRIEQMQQEARRLKQSDFEAIKQHKRKYEEMLNRQKEQRTNKILEFRKEFEDKSYKYPESRFYSALKEEELRKEEQHQQKSLLPKLNFDKRMKYAEKVKHQILPNMRVRKIGSEQQGEEKKPQARSMSVNELFTKGNEYMQQAKHLIKKNAESHYLKLDNPQPTQEPFKHKNYLTELKMNRTGHQKSELDKVKAIMDGDQIDPDKLFKAKLLASKMQKNAGNSSKKLMESIQAKIQILNKLT